MKVKTPSQIATLADDNLLAYLAELAEVIEQIRVRQEELWAARIDVYREGRRRDPAITHGRLAEAAGVSEVAIITKLKQLEEREADARADAASS